MADPCIEYAGCKSKQGYGVRRHNGKNQLAHRIAYAEANGLSLAEMAGKVVRHTCDHPPCINPAHLILGTQAENMQDASERGRTSNGESNGNNKLSEDVVRLLRKRYKPRCPINGARALGREFGVAGATVSAIIRGDEWKHIL